MSKGTLNKTMLIGNIGKDPVMRYTPEGKAIANFSIATCEVWKDKSGAKTEKTEWHNIVAFNKLAEIVGEYLKSGHKCYIEGKLQTRKWQNKEGKDQYTTEIVADTLEMLGGGKGAQRHEEQEARPQHQPLPNPMDGLPVNNDPPFDDDIPF